MLAVVDDSTVDVVACPFAAMFNGLAERTECIVLIILHELYQAQCRPVGGILRVIFRGMSKGI